MRFYLAGKLKHYARWILDRWTNPRLLMAYGWTWPAGDHGARIFLDCGAFTALNLGYTIDVGEYTDYCLAHRAEYEVVAALDVIGDAEASAANYAYMAAHGADWAMPTYHIGSDWRYLEALVERYPYVGLGGLAVRLRFGSNGNVNGVFRAAIRAHQIAERAGARLHGFGLSSIPLLRDLPWYSVDSTMPVQLALHGKIMVPGGQGWLTRQIRQGIGVERLVAQAPWREEQDWAGLVAWDGDQRQGQVCRILWNLRAMTHMINRWHPSDEEVGTCGP